MRYLGLVTVVLSGFFVGCGGRSLPSFVAPIPDVTGNWQIQTAPGVVGNNLAVSLSGALTNVGTRVTGTLRVADFVPGNGCGPFLQAVAVTGTVDAGGHLSLTSAQFAGAVFRVALNLPAVLSSTANGTLEIDGATCKFATGAAIGNQVAPIQGVFTGVLSPAQVPGNTASGTGLSTITLTQSLSADVDGQFPLSGSVQFSGTTCSIADSVSGTVSGLGVQMTTSANARISGPINPTGLEFDHIDVVFNGPPCAKLLPVSYVGSLTRQ